VETVSLFSGHGVNHKSHQIFAKTEAMQSRGTFATYCS